MGDFDDLESYLSNVRGFCGAITLLLESKMHGEESEMAGMTGIYSPDEHQGHVDTDS